MRLQGGCHCGTVRFEIAVEAPVSLLDCNCSICSRTGYLHLFVPHEQFALLSGKDYLTSYRFGTGAAEHLFCKACGIKSFYQPRTHPQAWSVNYRCLDPGHGLDPQVRPFDGQNWEQANSRLND